MTAATTHAANRLRTRACCWRASTTCTKASRSQEDAIHLGVRRPLSRYWFTTITGINWQHGAHYTPEQAADILGTHDEDGGLRMHFSKDVHSPFPGPGDR